VPSVVYSIFCGTISQHSVPDLVFFSFFLSYFLSLFLSFLFSFFLRFYTLFTYLLAPNLPSIVLTHTHTHARTLPWFVNKFRDLIPVKVLHNSLLNTTVVAFKVLSLGSYTPMPAPSPSFRKILKGNDPNVLPKTHGPCIKTMHLLTRHCLWGRI
jgi:hypothetical protein